MKKPLRYRRGPTDPHPQHTTRFKNRPRLQIPPEAQAVIDKQWPEVVRTFEQYDKSSGMLMLYGCVRDACKAAGWPDSEAYKMRDHLIAKMNAGNVTTYTGSDDRPGDWEKFNMKENRAARIVNSLLESGTRIQVTNRHNGQKYPAEGNHWPEHGWSFQIFDFSPNTWGRATSGVGDGPVIDQGFQKALEQRGWVFPPIEPPVDVRDQMMKKLAGDMFARENPPNPS